MPDPKDTEQQDDQKLPEEGNDKAFHETETGTKDGRVPADE
jgi:hypothetical protein